MESTTQKKKIVILGGGFGGLKCAFLLDEQLKSSELFGSYELILADKNPYHTYTPMIYKAAAISENSISRTALQKAIAVPLSIIFQNKSVAVMQKTVTGIDVLNGDIHFQDGGVLKYDYLILALGSETNYFNIPGLKENSLQLKSFDDALAIRNAIWSQVKNRPSPVNELKIIIGGAGITGVELAGEIQLWLRQLKKTSEKFAAKVKFHEAEPHTESPRGFSGARVKIVEAMPTILPGFNEKIIKKVAGRLKKIGVDLLTNEFIEKAEPCKITLKSKKVLDYDVLIWTGGVKPVSLVNGLPLQKEERGRVKVINEMACLPQSDALKLYGKIYGLGDAVCFYNSKTNLPIPQLAQTAIEQAKIVSHNVMEDIKLTEGLIQKLHYKNYAPPESFPYIIPVGGKYAAVKLGPFIISGFLGWVLKELVELYYLIFNVLPARKAVKMWLEGLSIFIKND